MILNEADFEDIEQEVPAVETEVVTDSEIEPEGPKQGPDTGVANVIHDLIIDENEAIQGYNDAAATIEEFYPEIAKIMHDIASEEFAHIGELQKVLEMISPNAEKIAEGEVEAENNLEELDPGAPADEELKEDTEKKSNGKWTNKGEDGEHGEFKTKKEADAQRKAMFANGYHEALDENKFGPMNDNYSEEDYKGYTIAFNFYGANEFTVQYNGDDVMFNTREEAEDFIDDLIKKGEVRQ